MTEGHGAWVAAKPRRVREVFTIRGASENVGLVASMAAWSSVQYERVYDVTMGAHWGGGKGGRDGALVLPLEKYYEFAIYKYHYF